MPSKYRGYKDAWGKRYNDLKEVKKEIRSRRVLFWKTTQGTPINFYWNELYKKGEKIKKGNLIIARCPNEKCRHRSPIMRINRIININGILCLELRCPSCEKNQELPRALVKPISHT